MLLITHTYITKTINMIDAQTTNYLKACTGQVCYLDPQTSESTESKCHQFFQKVGQKPKTKY